MNEKTQIGNTITNPPRAVQVRVETEASDGLEPHSAVVANVTILTDNRLESNAILNGWPRIVAAVEERVAQLLSEAAVVAEKR